MHPKIVGSIRGIGLSRQSVRFLPSRELILLLAILSCLKLAVSAQTEETAIRWQSGFSNGWILESSPALSHDGRTVYVCYERYGGGGAIAALPTPGSGGPARWVENFTGLIDSAPTIGPDGTIYVGSVNGNLYALIDEGNRARKHWDFPAGAFISSSPALGRNGTLYFGTGNGRIVALTATGDEHWSFQTESKDNIFYSIFSSPAIGRDDTIYVGSDDHHLYALTPEGDLKWRFRTGNKIRGSPAIGWDGTIYIGSLDQTLYALRPDGSMKWTYFTHGVIDASPVLGADGTVYFASGDKHFYALNPDGSDEQRVKWRRDLGAFAATTAAVRADGVIIVGADDGIVRALNPEGGTVRWTFRLQDEIYSSPVIGADGAIYIGSVDGRFYKLAGNGSPYSSVSSWPGFQRGTDRTAQLPAANSARLVNLSARVAAASSETVIAGFYVQGGSGHPYLIRAIGPALEQFGVNSFMPDPRLDLFSGSHVLLSNDNWNDPQVGFGVGDTATELTFPLPPGSKDASMVPGLFPGLYTAHVTSADGQGGVVLIEAYDARGSDPTARLANLSVRSQVGVGERILIVGFVMQGSAPIRLLIRGVGPGLAQFGVPSVLARPSMAVFRGSVQVQTNAGWSAGVNSYDLIGAAKTVGGFPLQMGSADCALVLTLDPGDYTVQVSGPSATTGEALAEIYVLP